MNDAAEKEGTAEIVDGVIRVHWDCAACGTRNEDDYQPSIDPMCDKCCHDHHWDDVIDPDEIEMLQEDLAAIDTKDHDNELYGPAD